MWETSPHTPELVTKTEMGMWKEEALLQTHGWNRQAEQEEEEGWERQAGGRIRSRTEQ